MMATAESSSSSSSSSSINTAEVPEQQEDSVSVLVDGEGEGEDLKDRLHQAEKAMGDCNSRNISKGCANAAKGSSNGTATLSTSKIQYLEEEEEEEGVLRVLSDCSNTEKAYCNYQHSQAPHNTPVRASSSASASANRNHQDFDAVSVGLMASGLAWVRRKKHGRYFSNRSSSARSSGAHSFSFKPTAAAAAAAAGGGDAVVGSTTYSTLSSSDETVKGTVPEEDHQMNKSEVETTDILERASADGNENIATDRAPATVSKRGDDKYIDNHVTTAEEPEQPEQTKANVSETTLSGVSYYPKPLIHPEEEEEENGENHATVIINTFSLACPTSPEFVPRIYNNNNEQDYMNAVSFGCNPGGDPIGADGGFIKNMWAAASFSRSSYSYDTQEKEEEDDNNDDSTNDDKGDEEPHQLQLGYFCNPNHTDDESPQRPSMSLTRGLTRIGSIDEYYDLQNWNDHQDNGYQNDNYHTTTSQNSNDTCTNSSDDDDDEDSMKNWEQDISWIPPVRCVPESNYTTARLILNGGQMHQIARQVLPKGIASCRWKRLYSLARDGDSFDVCLHYARKNSKTLLVIRTTRGDIFGAYAGETWSANHQGHYYGNNDTCLFSFAEKKQTTKTEEELQQHPHGNKKSLVDEDDDDDILDLPTIRVFKYTGVNRYIQYCDASRKMIAFGGGGDEGSFGLCVEQEFQIGSTGPCDTFDNEPLCEQENFQIVDLEVWGFLTGQF